MTERQADQASRKRARWVRWIVLGAVLAGMTAIVTAHQVGRGGGGRWASVDFLCPFGGLETLYALLAGDGFLRHTAASSVILLVGMLVMAVAFRRSFCGMLCPLGTLQGIFGAAGRKLFGRRFAVPRAVDRVARYLKYAVLVLFAVWTWQAAELVLRAYDPWVAWAHLTSADLLSTYAIGLAVLIVSLAGSLVYDRFFCKYLCPTGALLGLLSRVSFLNIQRDADACIDCGRCDKACMMNIQVATADVVKSSECISCNECVNACPVPGALQVTAPGGARAGALAATGAAVALMVGIVGATTLTGAFDWQMEGRAEARGAGHSGQGEGQGQGEGEGEGHSGGGSASPIKGWMSFADIAATTGIPLEELTAKWSVPTEDLGLPIKDIKDQYGFSPEDVRAWVEDRLAQ